MSLMIWQWKKRFARINLHARNFLIDKSSNMFVLAVRVGKAVASALMHECQTIKNKFVCYRFLILLSIDLIAVIYIILSFFGYTVDMLMFGDLSCVLLSFTNRTSIRKSLFRPTLCLSKYLTKFCWLDHGSTEQFQGGHEMLFTNYCVMCVSICALCTNQNTCITAGLFLNTIKYGTNIINASILEQILFSFK